MRLSIRKLLSSRIAAVVPSRDKRHSLHVQACGDNGQSLIEFALCLPLLLLIVTGILSFGITINNYMMLTDATNVGARQLAISRGQGTDPCATVASTMYAAAPVLTPAKFTLTFVLNGTSYSGASCSSTSSTTGAAGNLQQGKAAKVTAVYPCSLTVYGANFAPGCMLQAQTTELVQ
jgi:Flp pilus assembly protein TadG